MVIYRSVDGVFWVDDGNRLLIVKESGDSVLFVSGAGAALWRWLNQGLAWAEIRDLYSALMNIPASEGETQVKENLHRWVEVGLLEIADG